MQTKPQQDSLYHIVHSLIQSLPERESALQHLQALELYSAKRYAINMDFFSHVNEKLFKQLQHEPTHYNLYLDSQNIGLNIIDLEQKAFCYPTHTREDGTLIHSMIEHNLNLSCKPLNNKAYTLHTNHLSLHKLDSDKIPLTADICNTIIEMMQSDFGRGKGFHLPSYFLPSTTIFGLLGGMFIQFLLEQGYSFHSLLLFEEDIDMFRISLYFIDYPLLFERVNERSCYIFVKDLIHKAFVQNYFSSRRITNNFLRLELQLYDSPKLESAARVVAESYALNSRGWGSFDDESIGVRNTFENLRSSAPGILSYPLLHLPERVNAPICVVGNGASLNNLLPFIKENEEKMIIFSCGTALKPLKNAGIKPDFQIEIERIAYLRGVLESAPLEDTPLLCGNMVQPNALALAKEAYLFMRGGSASAYFGGAQSVIEFAAPYVGNAGFALACLLTEEVLICGLDCGYIKGESKHARGSFYGDEDTQIPKNAYKVQGNSECEVYADALFSLSSAMMSKAIATFTPRLVINLGNGAYINGTRSVKSDDFTLRSIDKKSEIAKLKTYMCANKKSVLPQQGFYIDEIMSYKRDILDCFCSSHGGGVASKKDLFARIDSVHSLSLKYSSSTPFVGVLFEGTIAHILHTIMLCALHIPHDDMALFYARCVNIIESGLNKMVMSYKMMCIAYNADSSYN